MKYRRLGNTGLLVSEISLGTMTFGGRGRYEPIGHTQQKEANEIVKRSIEAGINLIDTANVYSEGESERITGQALSDLKIPRHEVILATKVFSSMGPGPNDAGLSRQHIFWQVRESLKRLQTDYIDLYQIHNVDYVTPIEETLEAMDDLVRMGLVRYIGCSNLPAWMLHKAEGISSIRNLSRFVSNQGYYSLVGREAERELLPAMEDLGMGFLVWSPLAGGLLTGKFKRGEEGPADARRTRFDFPPVEMEYAYRVIDALLKVALRHKVSPARVAIAWLLTRKTVSSVIIGAKNTVQLMDNIAAGELSLSEADMRELEEASSIRPEYPIWQHRTAEKDRRAFLSGKKPMPL
jgi:aryl-alcohol dehydrogenase-like predicted oxidoreductase